MRGRPRGNEGFTLLELVIAMAILAVGLLGIATAQTAARQDSIRARHLERRPGPGHGVHLDHFDVDGNHRGRYERIVPLGKKMVLDLEHTFGIGALRGSLRIFSDSEVGLTLLKKVTNVHGELVFSDVPLQEATDETRERLTFPLFSNGAGHATEVILMNPSTEATDGHLNIKDGAGEVLATILR